MSLVIVWLVIIDRLADEEEKIESEKGETQ